MYRIMVVDDECVFRKGLYKVISNADSEYEIVGEAEDGAEALEMAGRLKPDLIMTDVYMPVMGGLELIREIRKREYNVDFIILSGYDEFKFAQEAIKYGVEEYLLKPMDVDEVKSAIQRVYNKMLLRIETDMLYKRCMVNCMGNLERLAENIWLLNDNMIKNDLESIKLKTCDIIPEKYKITPIFSDFVNILNDKLKEKIRNDSYCSRYLIKIYEWEKEAVKAFMQFECAVWNTLKELKRGKNHKYNHLVKMIREYIAERADDAELSLSETAAHFGFNPSYVSTLFKEELGISFIEYITAIRIEKARRLLSEGMKASEAAIASGYNDYPHFSKTFKKITGMSPSEYIEKIYTTSIQR
ncbi:MAG: response regulator [Clostridia bacterium]|nr:response regulator [Clostridia bacterium]